MKKTLWISTAKGINSKRSQQGAIIHAILVIDTANSKAEFAKIGQADYRHIKAEIEQMANATHYDYCFYEAIAGNFEPSEVKTISNNLQTSSKDIIFFLLFGGFYVKARRTLSKGFAVG